MKEFCHSSYGYFFISCFVIIQIRPPQFAIYSSTAAASAFCSFTSALRNYFSINRHDKQCKGSPR